MPKRIYSMSVVSHPDGNSLILSGGIVGFFGESAIYKFSCLSSDPSSCNWMEYAQKLQFPRYRHLSFIVKFPQFNCTLSSN